MAVGHFIRLGDKTTCGGKVLEGDTRVMMHDIPHARAGDRVSCGKDNKTYVIEGGISYIDSHGRLAAGTLDSISSCPCKAELIPSLLTSTYLSKKAPAPKTSRVVAQPAPQPARFSSTTQAPTQQQPPSGLMAKQPTPNKISIALRIGVFFDGTGNNADNTARGLACGAHHPITPEDLDASCKPYMSDPDSSYGNDLTNIKKLSDLYSAPEGLEGEGSNKVAQRMIYVEGIGTQAGEKDSLMGAGTGRGDTGVVGRVQQAFDFIANLIDRVVQENPDGEITSLTFDTFGFSRGAAAARHFANEVALGGRGLLERVLISNAQGFSRHFLGQYNHDIHVGFIGLFDTVASIAGFTNLGNVQSAVAPGLRLHLPRAKFSNVVHLVASDEHRANYPLSRVRPDHPEIVLPGVHSNIGGGYRVEAQEQVLIGPMQGLTVTQGTEVTSTSIYRDAQWYKNQMIELGWPAAVLEIVTPAPKLLPRDQQDPSGVREQRVYAGLQLKRSVRGELSRVYLRVMYALAKQKGVRFEDIDEHDPDYTVPTELQPLCSRFVAGDYRVTAAEEALLKLRYIHTSAHWNHPLDKTVQREAKLFYINAPTADAMRVQHPHVPD
ncbi:hypothetical protein BK659_03055 [Pseudomonas brassicacearum]|uniref:T6SS Phospholipase effector Tle1-like catalytic domain-containing protein n=1 Tax=Pseudomonas brassicacearum TaxID=930166 RepID=A0A423HB97_9PSED|nr:DUF2235 domain-containing protein [Pseudomonas brassicacearum]RON10505.1 hypothetical protein BK659_03055 [Pseudomonas brassicacearum]